MAKPLLLALFLLSQVFLLGHAKAESQCLTLSCQKAQLNLKVLSTDEMKALASEVRSRLQQTAESMANIWADTILEGDYFADEPVALDRVEEFKSANDKIIIYRITYSSRAWDTGTCEADPSEDRQSLESCDEGRIVESAFVSSDFKSSERDEENFAHFEKGSR